MYIVCTVKVDFSQREIIMPNIKALILAVYGLVTSRRFRI